MTEQEKKELQNLTILSTATAAISHTILTVLLSRQTPELIEKAHQDSLHYLDSHPNYLDHFLTVLDFSEKDAHGVKLIWKESVEVFFQTI